MGKETIRKIFDDGSDFQKSSSHNIFPRNNSQSRQGFADVNAQVELERKKHIVWLTTAILVEYAPRKCPDKAERRRFDIYRRGPTDNGRVTTYKTDTHFKLSCAGDSNQKNNPLHPCNFCQLNELNGGKEIELKSINR